MKYPMHDVYEVDLFDEFTDAANDESYGIDEDEFSMTDDSPPSPRECWHERQADRLDLNGLLGVVLELATRHQRLNANT